LVVVLVLVVAVFVVSVVLARGHGNATVTNPTGSRLGAVEDLFPPRTLTAKDASKAGADCVQGNELVITAGSSCTFVVPSGVKRVELQRVPASGPLSVTLTRDGGLTQSISTARDGPDAGHPDRYRLAVTGDGSVLTVDGCASGTCRVQLGAGAPPAAD
jgi:hypothetical protein